MRRLLPARTACRYVRPSGQRRRWTNSACWCTPLARRR